jgi:hypothetical protein
MNANSRTRRGCVDSFRLQVSCFVSRVSFHRLGGMYIPSFHLLIRFQQSCQVSAIAHFCFRFELRVQDCGLVFRKILDGKAAC